jgi:hypothetical protein
MYLVFASERKLPHRYALGVSLDALEVIANHVGHLHLAFTSHIHKTSELVQEQIHTVRLKLRLRQRSDCVHFFAHERKRLSDFGEGHMMLPSYRCQYVRLHKVQERQRASVISIQSDKRLKSTGLAVRSGAAILSDQINLRPKHRNSVIVSATPIDFGPAVV